MHLWFFITANISGQLNIESKVIETYMNTIFQTVNLRFSDILIGWI